MRLEDLTALGKPTREDQKFNSGRHQQINLAAGSPALKTHFLSGIGEQWHDRHARPVWCDGERHLSGVEPHMGTVVQIKLPELYEDNAAWFGPGAWRDVGGFLT